MDAELIKSLGLFTMPPIFIKKTQEQKKQEQLIQAQYRDFFKDGDAADQDMTDEERLRLAKEKEQLEVQKKREQHLAQLDATKKLYINEIMRRGNAFEAFSVDFDVTEADRKQVEEAQDQSYFRKLQAATRLEFEIVPVSQFSREFAETGQRLKKVLKRIEISEFCVRISYVDKILRA